jgi:hypothetical protein
MDSERAVGLGQFQIILEDDTILPTSVDRQLQDQLTAVLPQGAPFSLSNQWAWQLHPWAAAQRMSKERLVQLAVRLAQTRLKPGSPEISRQETENSPSDMPS